MHSLVEIDDGVEMAGFTNPGIHLLAVRIEGPAAAGLVRVRFGAVELIVPAHPTLGTGAECLLCIRPHDLRLAEPHHGNRLKAAVTSVQWQGDHHAITLDCTGTPLRLVSAPLREPPVHGAPLDLGFAQADATLIADEAGFPHG